VHPLPVRPGQRSAAQLGPERTETSYVTTHGRIGITWKKNNKKGQEEKRRKNKIWKNREILFDYFISFFIFF